MFNFSLEKVKTYKKIVIVCQTGIFNSKGETLKSKCTLFKRLK